MSNAFVVVRKYPNGSTGVLNVFEKRGNSTSAEISAKRTAFAWGLMFVDSTISVVETYADTCNPVINRGQFEAVKETEAA